MVATNYQQVIIRAAQEAGMCAECPVVGDALKTAWVFDRVEEEEIALSDSELDDKYIPFFAMNADQMILYRESLTLGDGDFREGLRTKRKFFINGAAIHMKDGLAPILKEKGCVGTTIVDNHDETMLAAESRRVADLELNDNKAVGCAVELEFWRKVLVTVLEDET